MLTNKIISIIISITAIIIIPIQFITTFIGGILVSLTFGLLLMPLSLIWTILFMSPLIALSYIYEKIYIARPIVSIVGIPLAVSGDIFTCLIPSMGEMESRYIKLIICQTFPYTHRFMQFYRNKLKIDNMDVLNTIFKEISKDIILGNFLESIKQKNYINTSAI